MAIFAYGLLYYSGIDVAVIILLPEKPQLITGIGESKSGFCLGHMMVAVSGNFKGYNLKIFGKNFYLAETTGPKGRNHKIGHVENGFLHGYMYFFGHKSMD